MGRRTTRRARHSQQGPSLFFIIALAIGLVLFVIGFIVLMRQAPKKQKLGATGAVVFSRSALVS